MKIATAPEMRRIDERAANEYGLAGLALMENAGGEVARKVADILGGAADKKVCIFCGKGNNGGDGFVAARHLAARGAKVKVFLLGVKTAVGGDALANLGILLKMGAEVIEIAGERDCDKAALATAFADCLVDALLGTGFSGEVSGDLAAVVKIINAAGKPVVAVDIPTGIDADTGRVRGVAVSAAHTVTFGLPKPGLLFQPGAAHAGTVTVVDIGLPAALLADAGMRQNAVTATLVRRLLPPRRPWAHKGTGGRVALVAGSPGLTGAAALASMAAVRAGAGLVTVGIAAGLNAIMEVKLTEVMTKPLPEETCGIIGPAAVEEIAAIAETADVLAIGPGLGRAAETVDAVREIVRNVRCPLVIDADGLNALAGHTESLLETEALAVLTPHPGELARLTGRPLPVINADRLGAARDAATGLGAIVVLKGPGTVIAYPDGEAFINTTGNAALATGGTGDVLTGVIAALVAQGLTSHDAAVAGVYLHGLAGELAAGARLAGMAAGDLLPALPAAIASLHGG
ncbi:NAD(P)H-hydrate dehydratase [Anaeroselena agilis]|uniref:Bifunctional NAD(P)H-hydrate repair enzyme n=1 Tax=Anaeroselena agilis TaxID=3063788 RepID=A0ABU3NT58_9FIRM|nr:NAD(P)H-hydrate dehydratase [Selenomonadales bacterium 4137-cl]